MEMELKPIDPLDPFYLAEMLCIDVTPISDLILTCPDIGYFIQNGRGEFSAITLFEDVKRHIYHNDSHHLHRQHSNIAHEIAHALLLHPPSPPLTEQGERSFDAEIEAEANWLAGALLVSEQAALHIARRKMPINLAASEYQVSEQMMQYRLNVTGAYARVSRAARKSRR